MAVGVGGLVTGLTGYERVGQVAIDGEGVARAKGTALVRGAFA